MSDSSRSRLARAGERSSSSRGKSPKRNGSSSNNNFALTPLLSSKVARELLENGWASPSSPSAAAATPSSTFTEHAEAVLPEIRLDEIKYVAQLRLRPPPGAATLKSRSQRRAQRQTRRQQKQQKQHQHLRRHHSTNSGGSGASNRSATGRRDGGFALPNGKAAAVYGNGAGGKGGAKLKLRPTVQMQIPSPTRVRKPRPMSASATMSFSSEHKEGQHLVGGAYSRAERPRVVGWGEENKSTTKATITDADAQARAKEEAEAKSLGNLEASLFSSRGSSRANMNEQLSTASARALATLDFRELSGLLWTARCKNGMDGSNSEAFRAAHELTVMFERMQNGTQEAERRLAAKVEDYKHELDSWLAAVEVTDSGQCDSTGQVEPSLMDLWPTTLSRARFCDPQNFLDSPILRAVTESNIAQPPRFDTAQCKRILAKWSQFGAHFPSQWLQESNALAEVNDLSALQLAQRFARQREDFLVECLNYAISRLRSFRVWPYCKAYLGARLLLDLDNTNAAVQPLFEIAAATAHAAPLSEPDAQRVRPNFMMHVASHCFNEEVLVSSSLVASSAEFSSIVKELSAVGSAAPSHKSRRVGIAMVDADATTPAVETVDTLLSGNKKTTNSTTTGDDGDSLATVFDWLHQQAVWCTISLRLSPGVGSLLGAHGVDIPRTAVFWCASLDSGNARVLQLLRLADVIRLVHGSVTRIQSYLRMVKAVREFAATRQTKLAAVNTLQRFLLPRIHRRMNTAVQLQAVFRGHIDRSRFFRWIAKLAEGRLAMACLVQRLGRCILDRSKFDCGRDEWSQSAILLQRLVRGEWSLTRWRFRAHWGRKVRLHSLVQKRASVFLTKRRRAADLIRRTIPVLARRHRRKRDRAARQIQTFVQKCWLRRQLASSARADRKNLIARREHAARLSQAAFRRMKVRSDPKLTLMRELSSDLLSVCAVTAHVKDGPRLERAVESAAKGGLPAHSSAMIAAQAVALDLRGKRKLRDHALEAVTDLLDEAKGTVDEVHRAIFFQSFPHCPRGIDIVATWNARIRDVKGRLEGAIKFAIGEAGCPATHSTVSVGEIMARKTLPQALEELNDFSDRRDSCVDTLRHVLASVSETAVHEASMSIFDVQNVEVALLLKLDAQSLAGAVSEAMSLGLAQTPHRASQPLLQNATVKRTSSSKTEVAHESNSEPEQTNKIFQEVEALVQCSNAILQRLKRLHVDQQRVRAKLSNLIRHAQMHAAQHAPVAGDVKELRKVSADAISIFGLPASDPMLVDAQALLSRLENLESLKVAAEADLKALLLKLEADKTPTNLSMRVGELTSALRTATKAGAMPNNSAVVKRATTQLRTWKAHILRQTQLDDALRAELDSLRSLEGINRWFGNEESALAKLGAILAEYQEASMSSSSPSISSSSDESGSSSLMKVASTLCEHISASKVRRVTIEQNIASHLTKLESNPRNATPRAFATLTRILKEASSFAGSLVAAQTSSTQPAEAKHAVVRGVTSDDEDTVGTMSTRASSRANESRPVSPGEGRRRRSKSRNNIAVGENQSDPLLLLVWDTVRRAQIRADALKSTVDRASTSMGQLESLVTAAVARCLSEFSGVPSLRSMDEFESHRVALEQTPRLDAIALKNEVLEGADIFRSIKAAIDSSGGVLGEEDACVAHVRDGIATLQEILDDFDAGASDRTTAVSELLGLRKQIIDFFDQHARLKTSKEGDFESHLAPTNMQSRHQNRFLQFVINGQVDKAVDLAIKHDINVNGALVNRRQGRLRAASDGLSVDTSSHYGEFRIVPLLAAIERDHPRMVKTLLELGADPNLPGFVHITPRSDKSGHTETHAASQKTSRNMRSLRRVSSSPSVKGRKQATAGVGESERQTSVVESDGSAQDLAISGPMLLFASCKHLKHREQIFHHLMEAGTNSAGRTEELLNTLLPSDAAVPAGAAAVTPLIVALRCQNFDAATLLVEEGASLCATHRDADGMTALHLAAQTAPTSLVAHMTEKLAVSMSANEASAIFKATSNNGWMPLHFAVFRGETSCVEQLLIACDDLQDRMPMSTVTADVLSATVAQRYTALDIAVLGGKLELVNLLQRYGAASSTLITHRCMMEDTVVEFAGSKADGQDQRSGTVRVDEPDVAGKNDVGGSDETVTYSPQLMPATHVAALLGDFHLLRKLFDGHDGQALRKRGLDVKSTLEVLTRVHRLSRDRFEQTGFLTLVESAAATADSLRNEFRSAFSSADKAGVGYLRVRHLRGWLLTQPSKSHPGAGSGLANFYSPETLNNFVHAFLFRWQRELLTTQSGALGTHFTRKLRLKKRRVGGGRKVARSRSLSLAEQDNSVDSPGGSPLSSPRQGDDDSSFGGSSRVSASQRLRATCATVVGSADEQTPILAHLLGDMTTASAHFEVPLYVFEEFCLHFSQLRFVAEGVGLAIQRTQAQLEAVQLQRREDNEDALRAAAASGNVDEILDVLQDSVRETAHVALDPDQSQQAPEPSMFDYSKLDIDVDSADEKGNMALSLAISANSSDAVQLLLAAKANPLLEHEGDGFSMLMKAACSGNHELFNMVLAAVRNATVGDTGDTDRLIDHLCFSVITEDSTVGETALLMAVRHSDSHMVRSILHVLDFDAAEPGPELQLPATEKSTEKVSNADNKLGEMLVNYVCDEVFDDEDSESDDDGSPTNKQSSKKEAVNFPAAALWVSAVAVMDTLLNLQERESEDAWIGLPSLLDPQGVLAPPLSAAKEALACITEIFSVPGADLEARGGPSHNSVLEQAVMEGVEPVIVCILAAKCNPNSFSPSRSHTAEDGTAIYNVESPPLFVHSGSPLMSAVLNNDVAATQLLVDSSAIRLDVVLAPPELMEALGSRDPQCAPDEIEDMVGFNALHVAAKLGHFAILKALLTVVDVRAPYLRKSTTPKILVTPCSEIALEASENLGANNGALRQRTGPFCRRRWPGLPFLDDAVAGVPEGWQESGTPSKEEGGETFAELLLRCWGVTEEQALVEGAKDAAELMNESMDKIFAQRVWGLCDDFDSNGDGLLTEDELRAVLEEMGASAALGLVQFDACFLQELDFQDTLGQANALDDDGKTAFDYDACLAVARRVDVKVRQQDEHGLFAFFEGVRVTSNAGREQLTSENNRSSTKAVVSIQQPQLFRSVQAGDIETVKDWIQQCQQSRDAAGDCHFSVDELYGLVDRSGYTLLMVAAYFGQDLVMKQILDFSEALMEDDEVLFPKFLNLRAGDGCTALILACSSGSEATVQLLLETGKKCRGATASTCLDLEMTSEAGFNALCTAVVEHKPGVARLLLEARASPNAAGEASTQAHSRDKHSRSATVAAPIHVALTNGYTDILQLLLEFGGISNLESVEGHTGSQPSQASGTRVRVEALDLSVLNADGFAPLMSAVLLGNCEAVEMLLEAGAPQLPDAGMKLEVSRSGEPELDPSLSEAMVSALLGDQDILQLLLHVSESHTSYKNAAGETLDLLILKLHGLSREAFLDLDLDCVSCFAGCASEDEVKSLADEEFLGLKQLTAHNGTADEFAMKNYLASYAFDIGDGTEVSVDQFYREDLFNAVVVALKHRLQCCFESDDPDMFRELQLNFYTRMMRLISLWELHSAMDRSGGNASELQSALFSACEDNNLEIVVRAASHDLVDVEHVRDENGETPLFIATLAIAKLFTAARDAADIDDAAEAYFLSAEFSEKICAVPRMLLKLKSNPNDISKSGTTALLVASDYGVTPLVREFLHHCGQLVEHTEDEPLHAVASSESTPRIDLNYVGPTGRTALASAVASSHNEVVAILLDAGASCAVRTCNAMQVAVSAVATAWEPQEKDEELADEEHESLVYAHREAANAALRALASHPSMLMEDAADCRPWLLWHYLLTMDNSTQLRDILEREVDSLVSEYPSWPKTLQKRHQLRQARLNAELVAEEPVAFDVNVVIPRHMVVAKTPRGNALKGLHARCLQQRWSPLYFATATCDYPLVKLLLDHGAVPMRSERAPGGMHELHLSIQAGFLHGFKAIWDIADITTRHHRSGGIDSVAEVVEGMYQVRFDNFLEFMNFQPPTMTECLDCSGVAATAQADAAKETSFQALCMASFGICDADGSGTIDLYELNLYFKTFGVERVTGAMFQPLVKFYFDGMDMDGDKEITLGEFRTWFLRVLEFREMWRRCAEVRGEHPLELDTGDGDVDNIQIQTTANGRLVAGQGASFARDVAVAQKQINSIVRRAVGEFAPVVADGMQMPETVQRSLGEELMLGAEENDVSLIAKVFAQCGNVDISSKNEADFGYTPLMIACLSGSLYAVQALLYMKADTEHEAADGARAVHMAVQSGDSRVLQLLSDPALFDRSYREEAEEKIPAANLRNRLPNGQTVLMLAVQLADAKDNEVVVPGVNDRNACLALLMRMQDFFTETEVNCLTPQGFGALHFAVSSENVAAIELLASHPFLRVDACGKSGITATYIACEQGLDVGLQIMLDAKADANHVTKDSVSLLYKATERGFYNCVRCLLQAGARPNCSGAARRECAVAAVAADFEMLQLILLHLRDAEPDSYEEEYFGLCPGLLKRHGVHLDTVLAADFSDEAKEAAQSLAPMAADEAFRCVVGDNNALDSLQCVNAPMHRAWLESLPLWRGRFSDDEWSNVVALSFSRVKKARDGRSSSATDWAVEYFRIHRVLSDPKLISENSTVSFAP